MHVNFCATLYCISAKMEEEREGQKPAGALIETVMQFGHVGHKKEERRGEREKERESERERRHKEK